MCQSLRFLVAALLIVSLPTNAQEQLMALPDGPGKELVEAACVACHETDIIYSCLLYTSDAADE